MKAIFQNANTIGKKDTKIDAEMISFIKESYKKSKEFFIKEDLSR